MFPGTWIRPRKCAGVQFLDILVFKLHVIVLRTVDVFYVDRLLMGKTLHHFVLHQRYVVVIPEEWFPKYTYIHMWVSPKSLSKIFVLTFTFPPRSRGSTLRSRARPLGRRDAPSVIEGDILAARAFVLLLICSSLSVWWLLEQPGTSCMELHPLFQYMLKRISSHKMTINMCDFGGPTTKRTLLYSSELEGT